jgi:hypothetical protein
MAHDDAFSTEMRRLPNDPDGSDPLALDQTMAEQLLAGDLDPADAPPAYAKVAEVLAAAAGPSTTEELAGEASALAAFRAAHPPVSPRAERGPIVRRRPARAGRLRIRLAALAVAAAVFVGGTAAAMTGSLPAPVQRLADMVLPQTAPPPPGPPPASRTAPGADGRAAGQSPESTTGTSGTSRGGTATTGTGPPVASSAAARGLCTAYRAGNGKGNKLDTAAFQALAAAAGGAANIPAWCERAAPVKPDPGKPQGGGQGQTVPGRTTPPEATLRKLCQDHLAGRSRQLAADDLEMLAAAAGGAANIPAWCERLAG